MHVGAARDRLLEPCIECHHETILEEPLVIWLQASPSADVLALPSSFLLDGSTLRPSRHMDHMSVGLLDSKRTALLHQVDQCTALGRKLKVVCPA